MVGVVPTFTHRQNPEYHVVAAFIFAVERLETPNVANRVDAPGHVVDEQNANQPAPEQSCPSAEPRPCQDATQNRRNQQPEKCPHGKQTASDSQGRATSEIGHVLFEIGRISSERPANMRMPEAADEPNNAAALMMWRMNIVGIVAVLVVPAVQPDPMDHRPLDGHRTECRQHDLNRQVRLERAVNQQPVEANADTDHRENVEPEQQSEIGPVEPPAP